MGGKLFKQIVEVYGGSIRSDEQTFNHVSMTKARILIISKAMKVINKEILINFDGVHFSLVVREETSRRMSCHRKAYGRIDESSAISTSSMEEEPMEEGEEDSDVAPNDGIFDESNQSVADARVGGSSSCIRGVTVLTQEILRRISCKKVKNDFMH